MISARSDIYELRWRKSTYSSGNGECVEVATREGRVIIRDSKAPAAVKIPYGVAAWESFLVLTKAGTFDFGSLCCWSCGEFQSLGRRGTPQTFVCLNFPSETQGAPPAQDAHTLVR
jgi:hypothetical protein